LLFARLRTSSIVSGARRHFAVQVKRRWVAIAARPVLIYPNLRRTSERRPAARLVLPDFPASARHIIPLALEDTGHELWIAPLRLPGGIGEAGNLGDTVARRAALAIRPMSLRVALPEKLGSGGRSSYRGARMPRGRT
jgi:hypothetical protein